MFHGNFVFLDLLAFENLHSASQWGKEELDAIMQELTIAEEVKMSKVCQRLCFMCLCADPSETLETLKFFLNKILRHFRSIVLPKIRKKIVISPTLN